MECVHAGFRRVKNRIVNRPSAVQKRDYLKLRAGSSTRSKAERFRAEPPELILRHYDARDAFSATCWRFCAGGFWQRMGLYPGDRHAERRKPLSGGTSCWAGQRLRIFLGSPRASARGGRLPRQGLYIVNRLDYPYDFHRRGRKRRIEAGTRIVDWVYGGIGDISTGSKTLRPLFVPNDEAAFVDARFRELIAGGADARPALPRDGLFRKRPYKHQIQ